MSSTAKLYTPQVLALATALADYPLVEQLCFQGNARSPVCGSSMEIGFNLDGEGRISDLGMKVHACAIGQAAAALFAQSAKGKSRSDITQVLLQIEDWLCTGDAVLPVWPGIEALVAARDYPGRHGAILLPWKAALATLP